ncbi:protein white-like isoform X2 [Euwallacea fornicatus]|uniref:protein white-like isoform X2 n=1 Tax=Euwallacea fornicatus TaxID=995702 RepID=UPI00338FCE19
MARFIFTWDNLKYSVQEKHGSIWNQRKSKKVIIDGVSGSTFSGSVTAIMGVSGSGKTTLLTLLSGERRGKGLLKINGRVVTEQILRSNSSFLQQKDLFTESLTVYEHMNFMAAMYVYTKPHSARVQIIHKLLRDLNLENFKYSKVQNLSSGEKRKLSLATKLLSDPCILFCDEPTTGLDSFSAISVVKLLETIAASGKIVFLTVHQPSSQLFELFDNFILLASNGKVVFQGSKENARRFFESQFLFCPATYNPADFYIKTTAIKSPMEEVKVRGLIEAFEEEYAVKFNFADIEYNGLLLRKKTDEKRFFYTLGWLIWRTHIDLKRQSKQYLISSLLIIVTALIIGISYSSTTITDPNSVQSIQGALLLIISELIFDEMYQVIYIFPQEIEIFIQEKTLYAALPYFLSKILSLIPLVVLHSLGFLGVYFICLQFLEGLQIFVNMYVVVLGASFGGCALGLCLSALFPTVEFIHLFIVPLQLMCVLLSGLWIKIGSLPKLFAIMKYFSPFYISFESICILYWNQVEGADLCSTVEEIPCYRNGTEVLKSYDFAVSYDKVLQNGGYMVLLIVVYFYLGYIGILRKRALHHL